MDKHKYNIKRFLIDWNLFPRFFNIKLITNVKNRFQMKRFKNEEADTIITPGKYRSAFVLCVFDG